jgi:cytochrome c oxidase subunit 2
VTKWSFFFLLIPIFGVASFALSPAFGIWLPENISAFGREIDALYNIILVITGVTFVGTQVALCYVLLRFARKTETGRAVYSHGNQKLEVIWTVIPAVVLLFIALAQLPTWIEIRFPSEKPDVPVTAQVIARQFEWRIIYPGPDGELNTVDDLHVPNELHVAKNHQTVIDLRSMDVLHSFFLPHLRVKYDAVPGISIPLWFKAEKSTLEFQNDAAKFKADDFADLGSFFVRLRERAGALEKFLFDSFTPATQQMLQEYDAGFEPSESQQELFLADINMFLEHGDLIGLHRDGKLGEVKLSTDTLRHAELAGLAQTRLLNRQVLQDAFGDAIVPLDRHYEIVCAELCGWGHYKMRGRLVVHETMADLQKWLDQAYAEQETAK